MDRNCIHALAITAVLCFSFHNFVFPLHDEAFEAQTFQRRTAYRIMNGRAAKPRHRKFRCHVIVLLPSCVPTFRLPIDHAALQTTYRRTSLDHVIQFRSRPRFTYTTSTITKSVCWAICRTQRFGHSTRHRVPLPSPRSHVLISTSNQT